jgi:hypothetical protein
MSFGALPAVVLKYFSRRWASVVEVWHSLSSGSSPHRGRSSTLAAGLVDPSTRDPPSGRITVTGYAFASAGPTISELTTANGATSGCVSSVPFVTRGYTWLTTIACKPVERHG